MVKYFLLFLAAGFVALLSFGQPVHRTDSAGIYAVGYRNFITTDSSRIYKPNTSTGEKFHFRPVEIDLWYPAVNPSPNTMLEYGTFLHLLEERSNRFQDDTVYHSLSSELVQYICLNLNISDTSKLTRLKTNSYLNADPARGQFPLILYMCSFNGTSYENISLFELLASHGYTVACITSVGKYPGNMSTNRNDLMEQVYDGSFTVNYLKPVLQTDDSKIGVMGYSWGGLAAFVYSLHNPRVKALLSLDGSEMHYYGDSKEEDLNFDGIRKSDFTGPEEIDIPYAYMESGYKQSERQTDSIFDIVRLSAQRQYVHFPLATHEDFSCLPSLAGIAGKKQDDPDYYAQFKQYALHYFNHYLKRDGNLSYPQWSLLFNQQLADSVYPVAVAKNPGLTINGKVLDSKSGEALAYVNIGIPDKNTGTVSGRDGSFLLKADEGLAGDSLKISMAGYESLNLPVRGLQKQTGPLVILLKPKIMELVEVVVSTEALPTKIKGNTTTSNFVSVGLPLKFLGSETGIKISLGKEPVLLKSFSFNISGNRLDTAVFRLNIYSFKKGAPYENIMQRNILVPVGKQTGIYTLSLAEYKLVMKGDLLISLEWIEGSSSGPGSGAIFLSAGFLNSSTWHRLTSQAKWKKASGMGVGFNVTVQKLKS